MNVGNKETKFFTIKQNKRKDCESGTKRRNEKYKEVNIDRFVYMNKSVKLIWIDANIIQLKDG